MTVGQCELSAFHGELANVRRANFGRTTETYWCEKKPGNDNDTLVKVSSKACFGHVASDGALWNMSESTWADIKDFLAPSLQGLYVLPSQRCMVQLQPNLTAQGFEDLRPKDLTQVTSWKDLWGAFRVLVQRTLLPLAERGYIYVMKCSSSIGTASCTSRSGKCTPLGG
jgi:hypothetical protein